MTAFGLGGTALVHGTTDAEQRLGWRREARFWGGVAPIVLDYWWHASSSSPRVKFLKYTTVDANDDNDDEDKDDKENEDEIATEDSNSNSNSNNDNDNNNNNDNKYRKLHERNAPRIYATVLQLGGLYTKLGQVLSVTALPLPNEYRALFRTLQSGVPGHQEFETVVRPTLEKELGRPLREVFEWIEEVPCGAASIGQAHRARLLPSDDSNYGNNDGNDNSNRDVVVKIQYPDAKWQVPADIRCVGDFLRLCVYFGVADESASKLAYDEFSRQFLSELDYRREANNLREVYQSSLDPTAPYRKRGVEIPELVEGLCTDTVITMSYIPGPKFEEEARNQLEALGIDTSRGIRSLVGTSNTTATNNTTKYEYKNNNNNNHSSSSWTTKFAQHVATVVGVDNVLFLVRFARRALLWSKAIAVQTIQAVSTTIPTGTSTSSSSSGTTSSATAAHACWLALLEWAKNHENAASQAEMLDWTSDAIDALFDVHGYQIFHQGLFNADAHPGNILVIENDDDDDGCENDKGGRTRRRRRRPKLGLIDYGQCKRLDIDERRRIAGLVLAVANSDPDEEIAARCRDLGFVTKKDSTKFLSSFAKLMFGRFRSEHLDHDWHKALHREDEIVCFPNELAMVYRASLLLRGLAVSFQLNVSVGEKWREHAEAALPPEDHRTAPHRTRPFMKHARTTPGE